MGCVPAPACKALLAQATALWPKRNKASDGICGDARHQARKSDHNQGNAVDLTHDPAHGVDAHAIAELVKASGDPRVAYIISNQRIWNPTISSKWRAYDGSNPHIKHIHISIRADRRNDKSPWPLTADEEFTMDDEAKQAFAALDGRLDVITDAVSKIAGEVAILRSAVKGVADDANGMSWLGERVAEIKADLDAVKEAHGITD